MNRVYIVAAKRTAIGSFGGSLKNTPAGELAAVPIKAALESCSLSPSQVDEVIVGNVVSADQGMNIGRQASLNAGIPDSVPAYCLNMVCGSGMKTVMDAASHIKSGDADIVVAGGVEVMSQIPFCVPASARDGLRMGHSQLKDLLISDGLTDIFNDYHMGVTAENVAQRLGISRAEQDEFALASQEKAVAAIEAGRFTQQIAPVEVKTRRETVIFEVDEYPKKDATIDGLTKLRPAFNKEGTVTAGNASGNNDGASAVILASEKALEAYNLEPLAEIVSYAQSGLAPEIMGLGPVEAVTKALAKAELKIEDIDLFELNEAFAAQAIGVVKSLAKEHEVLPSAIFDKANVNGGAIALGHPLGASGNRILVSLLYEMRSRSSQYGVASLCVGGGMGTAIVIKAIV